MQKDGCTAFAGKSPQEVLRMIDATPRPQIVLLDPADVAKHEEQLDDLRGKDAEFDITYNHSSEDDMERRASAVHPEYPYVFRTGAR